jgi:thiosulfate/3-mercaptopyruvate sulfurtransferase
LRDAQAGRCAHAAGHLPGARFLDLEDDLSAPRTGRNGRHPLPDAAVFAERLRRLGVNTTSQVVLYDASGGMFAARAWWMLQWLGHAAVAVLDGGLPAWQAEGLPLEIGPQPIAGAGNFQARSARVAWLDYALLRAGLAQADRLVIDARAADRFRGENETLDPVGGHIPGALNRCFQDNLHEGRFKPPTQLRAEWQAVLGTHAPQQVVHQCGSGVTACHNLLALAHAGLPGGVLYPGSWSEWCAQPDALIATG